MERWFFQSRPTRFGVAMSLALIELSLIFHTTHFMVGKYVFQREIAIEKVGTHHSFLNDLADPALLICLVNISKRRKTANWTKLMQSQGHH